jgi:hypothetical protein
MYLLQQIQHVAGAGANAIHTGTVDGLVMLNRHALFGTGCHIASFPGQNASLPTPLSGVKSSFCLTN